MNAEIKTGPGPWLAINGDRIWHFPDEDSAVTFKESSEHLAPGTEWRILSLERLTACIDALEGIHTPRITSAGKGYVLESAMEAMEQTRILRSLQQSALVLTGALGALTLACMEEGGDDGEESENPVVRRVLNIITATLERVHAIKDKFEAGHDMRQPKPKAPDNGQSSTH